MHIKSLRHVRDHVKVQGRPYNLLLHIATHTNMHTGEAFELSVERLAHRHAITPEWTRRLLHGLIATGELVVERSRGRHPNRYRFPLERCPACQDTNPEVEFRVDPHPEDLNPELDPLQPPTEPPTEPSPTLNWTPHNPELGVASEPHLAQIERPKEVKEIKEGPTPNKKASTLPKAEEASPFWCPTCRVIIPTCVHRVIYAPPRGRPRWHT
jgi:hypothetical protein